MGLYDRDYVRREGTGRSGFAARDMFLNLIFLNVGIFLVDGLLFDWAITRYGALEWDMWRRPWEAWQLLSYGFLHDPHDIRHIAFNMLGVWFFGSEVERVYGRREFLLVYLTMIVFGGIVWLCAQQGHQFPSSVIGASGAVTGLIILFALHFPNRTLLMFGILPMPAWVVGLIVVIQDLLPRSDGRVAWEVHLAGAGFALAYFYWGGRLERMLPAWKLKLPSLGKPAVHLHEPAEEVDEQSWQHRVDELLAKISARGEASLTNDERRFLEQAARRYQRRRD